MKTNGCNSNSTATPSSGGLVRKVAAIVLAALMATASADAQGAKTGQGQAAAQQVGNTFKQDIGQAIPTAPAPTAPQNPQAISQTGLLPVYGVDLRLDPSWVDSTQFPSQSPNYLNSGTSAAFQQVWGGLQPGGYNVLRMRIDVSDANAAANRVANLCVWAKSNNVQLILTLTGSGEGQPLNPYYPTQVSNFITAVITLLQNNGSQYLVDYSQVMAYQLDDETNHVGRHGGMAASDARQLALQAAKSLRQTERVALNGTGVGATPLLASASFDFELVKVGSIAGGSMTDTQYSRAYQALRQFLSGLAASPDIDLVAVDWFAGSIGGGGVDKAPDLLKSLLSDVPGKQIILTTGFSTAFRSSDEQKRLFTTAFASLSGYRASVGTNCPFVGAIFREGINGSNPNPNPPRANLPGEMDKWDWQAKAAELTAMWTQKKQSPDMSWWLTKVENNMGVITLQTDASGNVTVNPLPAQTGMTQIASVVSNANAQMATNPAPNLGANPFGQPTTSSPGSPATNPGAAFNNQQCGQQQGAIGGPYANFGGTASGQPFSQNVGQSGQPACLNQTLAGEAQKGMLGLLDAVFARLDGLASGRNSAMGFAQPGFDANGQPITTTPAQPGFDANGQPITTTPAQPGFDANGRPITTTPAQPGFDANGQPITTTTPAQPGFDANGQPITTTPAQPGTDPNAQPITSTPVQPGFDANGQPITTTPAQPGTNPNAPPVPPTNLRALGSSSGQPDTTGTDQVGNGTTNQTGAPATNVRSVMPSTFQVGGVLVPAGTGPLPINATSTSENGNALPSNAISLSPGANGLAGDPDASARSVVGPLSTGQSSISTTPPSGTSTLVRPGPVGYAGAANAAGTVGGALPLPPPAPGAPTGSAVRPLSTGQSSISTTPPSGTSTLVRPGPVGYAGAANAAGTVGGVLPPPPPGPGAPTGSVVRPLSTGQSGISTTPPSGTSTLVRPGPVGYAGAANAAGTVGGVLPPPPPKPAARTIPVRQSPARPTGAIPPPLRKP